MGTGSGSKIVVFCTFALRSIILELAGPFKAAVGIDIEFQLDATPKVKARIEGGEAADVILIARTIADEMVQGGHLEAGNVHDVARSGIGIAIRAGAARPDIGSVDAVKRMLLAARKVVYTDPASGGASGVHFAAMLERLGISDEMKSRTLFNVGSYNSDYVARGEADYAIQQIAEILPVAGVELLGPLPPELQVYSVFSAAIARQTQNRAGAIALVSFLTSTTAAPVIRRHGMEPLS